MTLADESVGYGIDKTSGVPVSGQEAKKPAHILCLLLKQVGEGEEIL